jgi:hypothetical protein
MVSQTAAGTGIESKGEVKPAFGGLDESDVALPDLTGLIGSRDLGQPVLSRWQALRALSSHGPKAALLLGPQALLAHEPGDAVLAAALAESAQIALDPRAAIVGMALEERLGDHRPELLVLLGTGTEMFFSMRFKAARADLESIREGIERELVVESFHYFEPLVGGCSLETMAKAFFKMSRWRLT